MIVAYAAAVPPVLAILYGAALIIASGRYDLIGRLGGLLLIPALGAAGAFLLGRAYGREMRRRRQARVGG